MNNKTNEMNLEYEVIRYDFSKAGEASSDVKKTLTQLGISAGIVRKVAIATYEAELNIAIHSLGGKIIVTITQDEINISAIDYGPGIDNVEIAMEEGFSTAPNSIRELGFGAGMGLPNMKRCSDIFDISSTKDKGTKVTMKMHLT